MYALMRVLRLLRLVRLVKLGSRSSLMKVVFETLKESRVPLMTLLFLASLATILCASFVYFTEEITFENRPYCFEDNYTLIQDVE